jgi:hypothetical protein
MSWRLSIIALVPVALFLLHPLNTQAVTYIVQRMASLAALFTLLAFVSYLTARYKIRPSPGWWYLLAYSARKMLFCLFRLWRSMSSAFFATNGALDLRDGLADPGHRDGRL